MLLNQRGQTYTLHSFNFWGRWGTSIYLDAFAVEKNIDANVLKITESPSDYARGDEALIALFRIVDRKKAFLTN